MNRKALAGTLEELSAYLRYQKILGVESLALSRAGLEALENLDRLPRRNPGPASTPGSAERSPAPESPSDLEELARRAGECARCGLSRSRNQVVFGEGAAQAALMFIGEGPGRDEDLSGRPFVGRAGQLLTRIIKAMGFERDRIYITNVVKCRPPNNRDPKPEESAACRDWLDRQLALIKPEVIVALGRVAAHNLLGTEEPISRLRGRFHDLNGIPVMPTFHPSYLLRQSDPRGPRKMVWEDMKNVLKRMGREAPRP